MTLHRLNCLAAASALALGLLPAFAQAALYVTIVEGLGGQPQYEDEFVAAGEKIAAASESMTDKDKVVRFSGTGATRAALMKHFADLGKKLHETVIISGIGCSSKTPDYFLGNSHGFNTVHGRMPSVLTGANLANRDLIYLGISGDGDSASIGIGQFAHAMRRGVRMVYIVENNGVYGLTKGQFSATADRGSKSKKGVVNNDSPIDLVGLAPRVEYDSHGSIARVFVSAAERAGLEALRGAIATGRSDCGNPCVE